MNYNVLDRELFGVQMLYGVELNILDREGNIDLPEDLLKRQDIVIASYHTCLLYTSILTVGNKKRGKTNLYRVKRGYKIGRMEALRKDLTDITKKMVII